MGTLFNFASDSSLAIGFLVHVGVLDVSGANVISIGCNSNNECCYFDGNQYRPMQRLDSHFQAGCVGFKSVDLVICNSRYCLVNGGKYASVTSQFIALVHYPVEQQRQGFQTILNKFTYRISSG